MDVDVYSQYFAAECVYNGRERKGVVVNLTSSSEAGVIRYRVSISFFPYENPEDFAISYDAYAEKEIYHAKGRRSKKREAGMLAEIRVHADELAKSLGGIIDWEKPLREARRG